MRDVGDSDLLPFGGDADRQRRARQDAAAPLVALSAKHIGTEESSRDSAPLCPAGHLPHTGGDWQLQRFALSGVVA
jgi:hypothetical protein